MASDPSDRDLLFGIQALQSGLIEPADLAAALRCWLQDNDRSVARILMERGSLSREEAALVEDLIRLHAGNQAGDAQPEQPAGVNADEPCEPAMSSAAVKEGPESPYPAFAVADLQAVESAGDLTVGFAARGPAGESPPGGFMVGRTTSQGGRFRLLRLHARGGIGDVFVARDSELHREVALKQIQPQHADDPSSRARFLIEAEVTGRLEHPGVVPVYGLGTSLQGRPFYAMRFVRGQSLKEAVDDYHRSLHRVPGDPSAHTLSLRQLLRRFIDVCNAVAYAHSRGVLHRDLKPANILLGPYGETLVVDWGLAKIVDRDDPALEPAGELSLRPSTASGGSTTDPGTTIGTPAYMSPEQAEGRLARIGPASDIYSLGATLYCIATGKAPQDDGNVEALLARLRRGEITPPRQVNFRVSRALEAIILKAMAPTPADRYPSARALAEDVDRWLADEPVLASPEPFRDRARRFMRRHRTGVAAVTTAFLAATVGLAAVLVVQTNSNSELKVANLELGLANDRTRLANLNLRLANQRERARFDLALDAIKTFHGRVSEDLLLREKQFDGLRGKLLHSATDFYVRLENLVKEQADRRSRAALGQAYHEIGNLTAKIGSKVEALAALRRGLELRLDLAADDAATGDDQFDAGDSLIAVAGIQEATGDLDGALASYRKAQAFLEPLARAEPDEPRYAAAVARCLHGTGVVQYHTGHALESLASYEQARAILQKLAAAHPEETTFQSDLALSHHDIGVIFRGSGKSAEALAAYGRAREINRHLATEHPDDTEFQSDLAQSDNDIGYVEQETGHLPEALTSLKQGRVILERLAEANPAMTRFQADLAHCHQVIGSIQDQTGHPALAIASFDHARAILLKLIAADPTVTLFQNHLAMNHSYVGLARQRAGRLGDAVAEFRKAIEIMERLAAVQPDGYILYNLACFRSLLAGTAAQPDSGLTAIAADSQGRQAVETLRRAIAAGLDDADFMHRDPDLDPLRPRADFQLLLLDLAFPKDPFAP